MIKRTDQPLRILLSNDDGIHAPGLKVLEEIARTLTDDIWIVAPESEQSGAAHSLTLGRPLRTRKLGEKTFSVDGTPTDCVMIALNKLLTDRAPDLMLSGVNHGSNLGEDVTYSGTVAAAMEATLFGVPAIALSQEISDHTNFSYEPAQHFAPEVIKRLLTQTWSPDVLLNINFPDVSLDKIKGVRIVKQGLRNINDSIFEWKDPRGRPFFWIGATIRDNSPTEIDTDLEAIQEGAISITPLHLDLTHSSTLETLKLAFL